MSRALLAALALFATGSVFAQSEKEKPKGALETDAYADLVQVLNHEKVKFDAGLKGTNLRQVLDTLQAQFGSRVKFVVREDLFRLMGPDYENILEKQFQANTNFSGVTLHDFLKVALADLRMTFLVRKNFIEVTSLDAVQEFVSSEGKGGEVVQLSTPLACGVYKAKPLADVLAEFERVYDRTITVSVRAGDIALTPVSARLMNVPLATAVDLLATEAGLVAVEKDGAMAVTTKQHAAEMGWKPVRATPSKGK